MPIESGNYLIKAIIFGILSTALYLGMFVYSTEITHFAYGTTDTCVVGQGNAAEHYQKATPELCTAQGGIMTEGNGWFVLVPILIAFAMSYVHGAFTGLFWDVLGLKAKK